MIINHRNLRSNGWTQENDRGFHKIFEKCYEVHITICNFDCMMQVERRNIGNPLVIVKRVKTFEDIDNIMRHAYEM